MADAESRTPSVDDLDLDFTKLSAATVADRGELWLLQWLGRLETALAVLDEETLQAQQASIETILLRLTTSPPLPPSASSSPIPQPGRPVRNLIARCYVLLFKRTQETRTLFDAVSACLKPNTDVKGASATGSGGPGGGSSSAPDTINPNAHRIASFHVAGQLLLYHGSSVLSIFAETAAVCMRTVRISGLQTLLRTAALECLRDSIKGSLGKAIGEVLGKEMLKTLKGLLSDKVGKVQKLAAECIVALLDAGAMYSTLADNESLMSACFKSLDSVDHPTRQSLCELVAVLLASSQAEGFATSVKEPQNTSSSKGKGKKGEKDGDDDDDPYPSIPAGGIGGLTGSQETKTLWTTEQMLVHLSVPFNKSGTSRRTRNAIIDIYGRIFTILGTQYVETNYQTILAHLVEEIGRYPVGPANVTNRTNLTNPLTPSMRYESLAARKLVGILLRSVIGVRILSEQGQILAIREIVSGYLKTYPALMPGQVAPSKPALIIALDEVSGLLSQLGSGSTPTSVQEVLYDPLVRLTSHPSHSVQTAAAGCLRAFCHSAPSRLSSAISQVLELLNRDLYALGQPGSPSDLNKRAIGHAHALAALIHVIPANPLYVSFDLSAKVMSLAIQLLKQSGNHELHISGIEIQVAWILVSGLMSLGPHFVKLHLPQLLILWRNALPKPTSKDNSAAAVRSETEWGFLLHIREATLGSILSFLQHNHTTKAPQAGSTSSAPRLVTLDIARRIAALLSNAISFVNSFAAQHSQMLQEQAPSTSSSLHLVDRDLMLRRRVFQCCVALGRNPATEPLHSSLLNATLAVFADPERYTGSHVQAAIAASSGSFTSIWDLADGFGYGVTSLVTDGEICVGNGEISVGKSNGEKLNRDSVEVEIEAMLRRPIVGSAEHDPLVHSFRAREGDINVSPPPPATGVVDSAVELFALYFPLQDLQTQLNFLQQMANSVQSQKTEKNPGRRMAILVNVTTTILGILRFSMRGHFNKPEEGVGNPKVLNLIRDIVKDAMLHTDERLRAAGSEALGRLCSLGGTSFMAAQIQFCVNQVVSNTSPDGRAGCALAFGEIYTHVGGLSAGPVLKTIVDILMSLSADPHPLVHFWSLQALARLIKSAGLSYAPFINGTLGMLTKLYMQDTHEPDGGSVASVNVRGDLPVYIAFCKILDGLVGVLGPELQDSERARSLILLLTHEFELDPEEGVAVEASRVMQHLLIFAIDFVDLATLVKTLREQLGSANRPLKVAAITSVYQLVQRNATLMSKLGGDRLVADLFALLDDDPSIEGARDTITSWLKQTANINPSGWIDLCQRIMSRTAATQAAVTEAPTAAAPGGLSFNFSDEESQGLGLDGPVSTSSTSRWRTQLFALECLHMILATVAQSGKREHFDIILARKMQSNQKTLLLSRVSDLIKMAFTASTAQVMAIRLEGLVVLRDVINYFKRSQDADFEEALLLEQYQAPIAAALTPAFSADSCPEVLASAIQVCATFVGSGVVKEIDRMGRILKLLSAALENCKEAEMTSLGDVKDLSSTASVMLKTSIFAAWAEFQTASIHQSYLSDVIRPQLSILCPFWTATLREYAKNRIDPDSSSASASTALGASVFDSTYSGLAREVTMPYYEKASFTILHAVASLLISKDPNMTQAMDGIEAVNGSNAPPADRTLSSEPTLFFFVIFGLAFEALATGQSGTSGKFEVALQAIEGLVIPDIAGSALLQEGIFDELCNLCYRLTITESPAVQIRVIRIVSRLATGYRARLLDADQVSRTTSSEPQILPAESKMTSCLQIVTNVLRQAVFSGASAGGARGRWPADAVAGVLRVALDAFEDIADVYPPALQADLYAIPFEFFGEMLKDEQSGADLIGPLLPSLKTLCERGLKVASGPTPQPTGPVVLRTILGLLSSSLQNIDDVRSRTGAGASSKAKSNLLTSVLLLTALPPTAKISQAVLEHASTAVFQSMISDSPEASPVSATAVHCAKSLILAASRPGGNPLLQYCIGQLLPGLIEFVARSAESLRDQGAEQITETRTNAIQEVVKTLVGLMAVVPADRKRGGLDIILPTLILLLDPSPSPNPVHISTVGHLLTLAASDSAAFKGATADLNPDQRTVLETSIRQSLQSRGAAGAAGQGSSAKPAISLKSFG